MHPVSIVSFPAEAAHSNRDFLSSFRYIERLTTLERLGVRVVNRGPVLSFLFLALEYLQLHLEVDRLFCRSLVPLLQQLFIMFLL